MKTIKLVWAMSCMVLLGMTACSEKDNDNTDEPTPVATGNSKYVFVAYSVGSQGVESAPYIISADSVTSGKVGLSSGVETDAYSFIPLNNMLFAAVWGGQGPITPFKLDGKGAIVQAGNTVNAVTAPIYGAVTSEEWVGGGFVEGVSDPMSTLFRFDAKNLILSGRNTIDMTKVTGNGEMPSWYGVFPVDNDKLYIPFECFPGVEGQTTKYKDSTWIMVVSYPGLQFQKVIRDGRSSFIGSWFGMQGLKQIEDGDVYAWSTAADSKNPSAIMRVKKGADTFDQSYFFNVEEKTGLKIGRGDFISGSKFLMSFYTTKAEAANWSGRTKLAIVDVKEQTITWVTGVPEHAQMSYKQKTFVESDGNTVRYVLKDDAGVHYVYNINASTATGTRGMQFEGVSDITTISKLTY